MNISYCLINSPFKNNIIYLNGNLDYKPPNHKSVTLFGTLTGAASKSTWELKCSVPVNGSRARGFDYTLKVANIFDNIVINNKLYIISIEPLTYKNHVLCNTNYRTYWTQATNELQDLKNENGTYKLDAFHRIRNTFIVKLLLPDAQLLLATVFSITCIVEERNLNPFLLKPITLALRKRCMWLNSWTIVMKKLDGNVAKIIFYSFPKEHIQDYVCLEQDFLDNLKNFFQGPYDANPPK